MGQQLSGGARRGSTKKNNDVHTFMHTHTNTGDEDLARAMGIGQQQLGGARRGSTKKSKWGTVAGVSLHNTPIYVLEPKVRGCFVCMCVYVCVRVCV